MDTRIVVTGIGVVSPNGIGKDNFWQAVKDGVSGIKDITLFDTSSINSKLGGQISDFNPKDILGPKGLRNLDRTTLLAMTASKLALDDAKLPSPIPESNTETYGVSLGSTMGSVWSISEFDKESLREGPRAVNPALFPNTVMNSAASQISIKFNIKGFNTTIASGFTSSIDAVNYAFNLMQNYGYDVVLSGGVEELCEQTYKGFYKIGALSGSRKNTPEISCPFDKRHNGMIVGEGSAVFIMEKLEHAKKRKAKIYAEILGYGTSFDLKTRNICNLKGTGAALAMRYALEDARTAPEGIDYVSASANSTIDCDTMETRAVKKIFGNAYENVPISSIKSMIGESFSASGAMNLAASIGAIEKGFLPPTVNFEEPDKRCDLNYVPNNSVNKKVGKALINSFCPTGSNSCLVVGKYE